MLVPIHKSYVDFWLLSYICFYYDIELPFVAASENFLNITMITNVLRNCGGFFVQRKNLDDPIYQEILTTYVSILFRNKFVVELFIERHRGRLGKVLKPKDRMFDLILSAYFQWMGKDMRDIKLVPITLNYERIFEGETFPLELLGEAKIKESLTRTLRAARYVNETYGRVFVNICEPISLQEYAAEYTSGNVGALETDAKLRASLARQLKTDIVHTLSKQ